MPGVVETGCSANADSIVASVDPSEAAYRTTDGLSSPGDVATYRVYVVLNTGNEAGSNDVTITRP